MDESNTVLVVDDEPHGFDVIEAHLYREGYNLVYVSSGIEALNRLDSVEPDVILLDVMMPQMDGIEVCRKIKSDQYWKHIPVIIVTALSSKEDLARSLDAGADDFVTKPVSGVELRARVRSMLRIKHQYDELEATMQLREDLSNMIVHDLRNPLTTILMSSSLLINSELDGKNIDRAKLILSAGHQLDLMINDLLILAKMQSGKMVLKYASIDLNKIVSETLSQFDNVANLKKLELKINTKPNVCPILGDANLIRRVLENLLSNAIKFSPPNKNISLKIECYNNNKNELIRNAEAGLNPANFDTKQVTIQVADEGCGIREDLKQRIFEKYEVGNVVNEVSQLGLGLAFCKMVVEAHGGQIFVEDNQPQGSIFTVVL